MSFHVLRYAFFKALGGRVAFDTLASSNIELSEIYLLTVKKKAMLAASCDLGCHLIRDQKLTLAPIFVDEGAQILVYAKIGPHSTIGKHSVVGVSSKLGYKIKVGDFSVIGNDCVLESHIRIGNNVKIGSFVIIESAVTIEDGVSIPSGSWIRSGSRILQGTVFENKAWQTLERQASVKAARRGLC